MNTQSLMYGCCLGTNYIAPLARTVADPYFESGVIKIQRHQEELMNNEETSACKHLLSETVNAIEDVTNDEEGRAKKIAARKRRRLNKSMKYSNCSFILGLAAEVERLWSIAEHVNTQNRKSRTPILLESSVFLLVNEKYWDLQLVSSAMRFSMNERVVELSNEDTGQDSDNILDQ